MFRQILLLLSSSVFLVYSTKNDSLVIRARRQNCGSGGYCGNICCFDIQLQPQMLDPCCNEPQLPPNCVCVPVAAQTSQPVVQQPVPVVQQPVQQSSCVCPTAQSTSCVTQPTAQQASCVCPPAQDNPCGVPCLPNSQDYCCILIQLSIQPQPQQSPCPTSVPMQQTMQSPCYAPQQATQAPCPVSVQPVVNPCPTSQQSVQNPCYQLPQQSAQIPCTATQSTQNPCTVQQVQQQNPCCQTQATQPCSYTQGDPCYYQQQQTQQQTAASCNPCPAQQTSSACGPCPVTQQPVYPTLYPTQATQSPLQCSPACQPSCQSSCMTLASTSQSQYGSASVPCDAQICVCPSGYVKCAEQTCCLRYRYTQRKSKRDSP